MNEEKKKKKSLLRPTLTVVLGFFKPEINSSLIAAKLKYTDVDSKK